MTGNPKVVKDPFYAENRINPGVARAEGAIAEFGIIGVKPCGPLSRCVMRSDVQPNVEGRAGTDGQQAERPGKRNLYLQQKNMPELARIMITANIKVEVITVSPSII